MSKQPGLTFAFLQHRPAAAAEVIQGLELAHAAAFLDTVPARLAAPVFERMAPYVAAQCMQHMAAARSAASLRLLAAHDRTSVLRQVREPARTAILDALPEGVSKRLQATLSYPSGTVGAALDPDVPVLNTDTRIGTARRNLSPGQSLSHVFLADATTRKFAGAVRLADLMQANETAELSELEVVHVRPLYNRTSLTAAGIDPVWDEFLVLPVVGRNHVFLGGLSRTSLRRALQDHHERPARGSVPRELVGALAVTAGGLVKLVTNAQASASAFFEHGEDHHEY